MRTFNSGLLESAVGSKTRKKEDKSLLGAQKSGPTWKGGRGKKDPGEFVGGRPVVLEYKDGVSGGTIGWE